MEDLERRILELESKLKSETGGDGEPGNIWRVMDAHSARLEKLDSVIWRGNGKDSLVAQLVRLRTELRVAAVVLGFSVPALYAFFQHYLQTH